MNAENIITAILDSASRYADETLVKASAEANKIVESASSVAQTEIANNIENANNRAQEILKNKRTLISLETRKTELSGKREIIENVYETAVCELLRTEKSVYLTLVEKLINDNAENGETVVIDKNAPFNVSDVEKLAVIKQKSLTVVADAISGGVVIKNANFDKDLTFAALVSAVREETEFEIAGKLF